MGSDYTEHGQIARMTDTMAPTHVRHSTTRSCPSGNMERQQQTRPRPSGRSTA